MNHKNIIKSNVFIIYGRFTLNFKHVRMFSYEFKNDRLYRWRTRYIVVAI